MTIFKRPMLANTACTLMLAISLIAANGPAVRKNKNMTTTTAMRNAWSLGTVSGRITMVDPDRNLVVVETPDGVPFDMVITAKTLIKSDQVITIKSLTRDMNKGVSVRFTPQRSGDVAESIQINE